MQLMSDALAVTGSRHGVIFEPLQRRCRLIRFSRFDEAPEFGIRAGLKIGRREIILPLAVADGAEDFTFLDQRTGPATWTLKGLDAASGLILTLQVTCPFRPGDANFSTAPVLLFDLSVRRLTGQFRWTKVPATPVRAEVFLEITGGPFRQESRSGGLELAFDAIRTERHLDSAEPQKQHRSAVPQRDRLTSVRGRLTGRRFRQVIPMANAGATSLRVAWSTWSEPVLTLHGEPSPFRYTRNFSSLASVSRWAAVHAGEILREAEKLSRKAAAPAGGAAMDHLLAYTLHSWMLNTWWTLRPDGRDWFSVWEGNCYFHSTVDVEFTQAPFYLLWWPELLGLQIDQWTGYAKSAEPLLGPGGKDAAFLSHDIGWGCAVGAQYYPHEMEIEETANWILLLHAHGACTRKRTLVRRHASALAQFTRFLLAADTDGDGIPDRGVANTVDDGSPAIQYGTQQTYLAVKTLGALTAAALLLEETGQPGLAKRSKTACRKIARKLRTHGWAGDHFTVLLKKQGSLKNPWTGEMMHFQAIPGWDAPHIFTANTLPVLDLAGLEIPLDEARVKQDLRTGAERCLRAYGCAHTDFQRGDLNRLQTAATSGLAGAAQNPGWISMNMLRDLAALRRGIDLTAMAQRYWDWQVLTNTQGTGMFFETFGGNNLHFYPRGVALWGIFACVEKPRRP